MTSLRLLVVLGTLALASGAAFSVGCGGDSNNTGGGGSAGAGTGGTATGGSGPGGQGTGGTTSSGGGGAGGQGAPFGVPPGEWTFVPIPGAKCINNTATGIAVNTTAASDDVIIYMEGGNACFNQFTCGITYNTDGYDAAKFNKPTGDKELLTNTPMFQRSGPTALFKSYNFVYVPYCTGDVHAGDNEAMVGGAMRYFHGAKNSQLYFDAVKAALPNAKHIVLAGSSAGGFGAAFNYDRLAKTFPNVKAMLIDDSGPPMSSTYVAPCLQQYFITTWGLDKTLPADCADCVPGDGAFMEPLVNYIATTYSDRRLSLVSSSEDGTISKFWGYGDNDCSNLQSFPGAYDGPTYAAGLEDLRDRIIGNQPNFKMFLIDGTNGEDNTKHVWLGDDPTMVLSNDVKLSDWLTQMLNDSPDWANVPLTGE
ncbi:MAG TPA: pectin acetylesterase-family hydrolase [Minicystis sp.]|nr:pectin acetylesterase-family hydrolase [Minicystis sp.]